MRHLFLALTLGAMVSALPAGCTPRMAHSVIGAAILTAAIVGTAHILVHHDAHFHDPYCGHHRRYHDGHWVYYYEDRWEYYDPDTGRWYYYSEGY